MKILPTSDALGDKRDNFPNRNTPEIPFVIDQRQRACRLLRHEIVSAINLNVSAFVCLSFSYT